MRMKENKKGTDLAKVLWYYNLLPDVASMNQKIICPFHEDVNPSLIVNLEEGRWFCFGCNLSGDAQVFSKLMEQRHNKLDDLKAYRKYVKILKSDKCSDIKISASVRQPKASNRLQYDIAYDYYYGLRKVDWEAPEASEEISCKNYMIERGFNTDVLNACKAKITYNESYPIIFPMLDNGKFKGWVCRTTNPDIEKRRKYLYNKGFSRATTLVGDYGSKSFVLVVEGYMDRLKFIQYGETNVVAILGWKMSQQQIDKLKQAGIKTIISALDNDECGRKGTLYLKNYFDVVRFPFLKGIKDPGEMTQETFNKMLSKAKVKYKEHLKGGNVHGTSRQN